MNPQSVRDDGYTLYLEPIGIAHFGQQQAAELTHEGCCRILLEPIRREAQVDGRQVLLFPVKSPHGFPGSVHYAMKKPTTISKESVSEYREFVQLRLRKRVLETIEVVLEEEVDQALGVLPPSSVATRLRAVVQVRKRAGCAPQ